MFLLSSIDFTLPLKNPVIIFSLVLFIILFAPILFNKIKVPHIIGLIIAGVIVGPYGLNLLRRDSSIVLFGTVGLLYIMFLAGLEIDLGEFKKNTKKILVFGFTTFILPLGFGLLASYYILGYGFMSSILLASMFSTHTLVSYPIASKYGVTRNRAVSMTVGGTMITDILALLILAAIAGMAKGEVSSGFWIQLGISSILFVCIVFFLFPLIIRWFFKNFEDSVSQYIFVLAMVFLAAFLAEAAGIEAIIGAFFAGLVLNRFVPHSSHLMSRIDFVGNALFIPFFLISVGMLVDVTVLVKGWGALKVAAVIIVTALATKYLAALITQKAFKLTAAEGRMIFGLSTAHAAATLAIILVGYNIIIGESATGEPIRLLNEDILNGTILLILVSCAVSSFVVEKASKDLVLEGESDISQGGDATSRERILLALAYPDMVKDIVELGLRLKPKKSIVPVYGLNIIDEEKLTESSKKSGKKILESAMAHANASDDSIIPLTRYDSSVSNGIVYTIKEQEITDLVIGLHKGEDSKNILGPIVGSIVRRSYDSIFVYKPVQPINTLKRMVVVAPPKAETEAGFLRWLSQMIRIAREGGMSIHFYADVLTLPFIQNICERRAETLKIQYTEFSDWEDFLILSREIKPNDLFVVVASRKGNNSYHAQQNRIPSHLSRYFSETSFLLIYPKQLESGINMGNIEQADTALMDTITDQIDALGKAGRFIRKLLKK